MSSPSDLSLSQAQPFFNPDGSHPESSHTQAIIQKLGLRPHPEGGYFVETDRDIFRISDPFGSADGSRSASTSIHYLLTPKSPLGHFHRNKARTVHTLHKGRGVYVIIHADEVADARCPGGYGDGMSEGVMWKGKARVEMFVVGQNVLEGEKLQWIVEGGKYKASFLLPDQEGGSGSDGLLISETVVPGFEYSDHDFMKSPRLEALVTVEQVKQLAWMLRSER